MKDIKLKRLTAALMLVVAIIGFSGVIPIAGLNTIQVEASVDTSVVSVKTVQKSLNNYYDAYRKNVGSTPWTGGKLAVDGICGDKTNSAIKVFQRSHVIKVDGICGKDTWRELKVYNY